MSKANNLTDFLTDTANAIRAKIGTTGKINPQQFAAVITQIPNFVNGAIVATTLDGSGSLYIRPETNSTTLVTLQYLGNKAYLGNGEAISVPIPSNGLSLLQFTLPSEFYSDGNAFIVIDNVDYDQRTLPASHDYQIVIYDTDMYILQI